MGESEIKYPGAFAFRNHIIKIDLESNNFFNRKTCGNTELLITLSSLMPRKPSEKPLTIQRLRSLQKLIKRMLKESEDGGSEELCTILDDVDDYLRRLEKVYAECGSCGEKIPLDATFEFQNGESTCKQCVDEEESGPKKGGMG